MIKKFVLLMALLNCFIAKSQVINCPKNIDFEDGNYNNWSFGIGTCCPMITSTASAPLNNRHKLCFGAGVDPYGLFPIVPHDNGKYVLKLGNNNVNGEAESAFYKFMVPNTVGEFSLLYKYAVVLQEPGHTQSDQPRFVVKIHKVGSSQPLTCASFTYVAMANLPGFKVSPTDTSVLFKDWSVGSIDLTPFKGDSLILEFSTGDCGLGGHFGYAYIDVSCSLSNVNAIFCKKDSILNLQAPPGFQNYNWYNGNFSTLIDTGAVISIPQPDLTSDYYVIVNPYSGYGCIDTFKINIIISDFNINISDSITICDKENYKLLSGINGNSAQYKYLWTPSLGLTCYDCSSPEVIPSITTTYSLEVTDQYGCKLNDSIKVIPSPLACCKYIFIPNAFTPDKNGINDIFKTMSEIELSNFKFSVFNRWGELLWQTKNELSGWDGHYKNEPQPLGTYFYMLEYECTFDYKKYTKSGDFILIR